MKKLITIIFLFCSFLTIRGQCPDIDGSDIFSADQVFRIKDLPYGKETTERRQMLDLYIPAPLQDCKEAKLIVVIHGGSFEGGNKNQIKGWGYHFARKGFYVALINYRLNTRTPNDVTELMMNNFMYVGDRKCAKLNAVNYRDGMYKMDKAWYFAVQDSRAALSYVQYNLEEREKEISRVYVVGESAGGISALGMALGQQEDFNAFNPLLESYYGSIDSRITHRPSKTKSIDAVISISGGLANAHQFLGKNDSIPVLFFHGGNDRVVPICTDACSDLERSVNGPLRIKEIVDSNHIPMKLEMHLWAEQGHHLIEKYDDISDHIMEHIGDDKGPTSIDNEVNLYPSDAMLFNCAIAELRNEIKDGNLFISDGFKDNGITTEIDGTKRRLTISAPGLICQDLTIEIYNGLGKQVHAEHVIPDNKDIVINTGILRPGIYEILIKSLGANSQKIKVFIQ